MSITKKNWKQTPSEHQTKKWREKKSPAEALGDGGVSKEDKCNLGDNG